MGIKLIGRSEDDTVGIKVGFVVVPDTDALYSIYPTNAEAEFGYASPNNELPAGAPTNAMRL